MTGAAMTATGGATVMMSRDDRDRGRDRDDRDRGRGRDDRDRGRDDRGRSRSDDRPPSNSDDMDVDDLPF